MKPSRITIIRHAESLANVDRSVYETIPDWKVPLTEAGRKGAREAGQRYFDSLSPLEVAVYLSPYIRTKQTWEEMDTMSFQVDTTVREDPRLREQEWHSCQFETRSGAEIEKERDAHGTFFYRFLNGESGADCWDRCTTFLDTLYRDFEKPTFPENVLIVSHAFTMRVLLMRWLHYTVDEFHLLKKPANCGTYELRLGNDDKYHLESGVEKRTTHSLVQ